MPYLRFLKILYLILVGMSAAISITFTNGCSASNVTMDKMAIRGIFDVRDYGAVGDGRTLDTEAIQTAIDACGSAGGGEVYFHGGRFLSGTIYLDSNVTLHIEAGAVLLGSPNLKDYPVTVPQYRSYTDNYTDKSLIYAEGKENIAIIGHGAIDGQGASFKGPYKMRPYLIRVVRCKNVVVKDITLRNSAMWMQHYLACDRVAIRGISVYNHCNKNNDMIDIDGCHDVTISDCIGDTDDDALTLKSTSGRACENVTINNCLLSSHCNALKMGTESNGGFRNITIANCVITISKDDSVIYGDRNGLAGIALEIVDGGILEGITISNIRIADVQNPIFLRLGNRARPYMKDMEKPDVGKFRNVKISNIIATGASNTGCSITGIKDHPIENISLSNIKITYQGRGTLKDAEKQVEENAEKYPESTMFGVLPAYGFYCRHIKGIELHHVDLRFEKDDDRPAMIFDDVRDLDIFDFDGQSSPSAKALIWLEQVNDAFIHGCRPTVAVKRFLRLDGNRSNNIVLMNNDLSKVEKIFEKGHQVNDNAVHIGYNRTGRF